MEEQIIENRGRRYIPKALKLEILRENQDEGVPISVLARKHGIHPITVYQWRRSQMSDEENELTPEKIKALILENQSLKSQVKTLKSKVGDLCITNEILEVALDIAKKKVLLKQANLAVKSKPSKSSKS